MSQEKGGCHECKGTDGPVWGVVEGLKGREFTKFRNWGGRVGGGLEQEKHRKNEGEDKRGLVGLQVGREKNVGV